MRIRIFTFPEEKIFKIMPFLRRLIRNVEDEDWNVSNEFLEVLERGRGRVFYLCLQFAKVRSACALKWA